MKGVLEIRVYGANSKLLEITRFKLPRQPNLVWVSGIHLKRQHFDLETEKILGRNLNLANGQRYHGSLCATQQGGHGTFIQIPLEDAIAFGYTPCQLNDCNI